MSEGQALTVSYWLKRHLGLFGPGITVLDFGCGAGQHAIAASLRGASVTAIDKNPERLIIAQDAAVATNVRISWICADLETFPLPTRRFQVVMGFRYLDRARMPTILDSVAPGGYFLYETFRAAQRAFGWGPKSRDHLLRDGELAGLVKSFEIVEAREAIETFGERSSAVASILARRPIG